jgi:predicted  nucleic acid-binding Zn-ribbon protein
VAVRIQEIQVQKWGPVSRFSVKPGLVNLIYGRNEQGKTFLVEFILRTLFGAGKQWRMRPETGNGKIGISGIDVGTVYFSAKEARRLNDLMDQKYPGLPANPERLLVVKGAELDLADDRNAGVDGDVLKRYLSSQGLLDIIGNRISKTLLETRIENRWPVGPKRGEIKSLEENQERLKTLDVLFRRIDQEYSGGRSSLLETRLGDLRERFSRMESAMRHKAFLLSGELNSLREKAKALNRDLFREIEGELAVYASKSSGLEVRIEKQKEAEKASEHYPWLEKAVDWYAAAVQAPGHGFLDLFLPVCAGIFMLAAVLSVLFRQYTVSLISLAGLSVSAFLYFFLHHRKSADRKMRDELADLKTEFKKRFGRPCTGLPDMQSLLESLKHSYHNSRFLRGEVGRERDETAALRKKLEEKAKRLTGKPVSAESLPSVLQERESQIRAMDEQISRSSQDLAALDVDPSDYERNDPGIPYSKREYQRLQEEIRQAERETAEEQQKLSNLKQAVCRETRDEISVSWDALLEKFRNVRQEAAAEYRTLLADILGKKAVHAVLETLRVEEERNIREGLGSEPVISALKTLTNRYTRMAFEEKRLTVSDENNEFDFDALSTGAREQVLLALRIGFAQRIFGQKEPLFLILDDAFQYSDWQRRERMVESVFGLSRSGWQVFYFTMDDHLARLFDDRGRTLGKEYVRCDLKAAD